MEFQLSEDQLAIKDAVNRFLQDEWDQDLRRKALDESPVKMPDDLWQQIIEMGWIGISVAEARGGSGLELLTAAIIIEEAGQVLLPSKLATALVSAYALEQCEKDSQQALLTDLINGQQFVSPAVDEANGLWGPENIETTAVLSDSAGTVSGTKILVPDGDSADVFLVAAILDGRRVLIRIPADAQGVTITPMARFDGQSICEVRLEQVAFRMDDVLGEVGDNGQLLNRVYDFWTTLVAADLLGVTTTALEVTNDYAKVRQQFGRPIGSFQAVSHRLADTKVEEEVGRSLLYGACLALQEHSDSAYPQVSAVKAWMSETAVKAGEAALQLHGGIGYTWELDVHLYLRQARSNAVYLGDAAYHRARIGRHIAEQQKHASG